MTGWQFLWVASRGYRLTPWRSPYIRWRMETYSGIPAKEIGFTEFWGFVWRERRRLGRFLGWVEEMSGHLEQKSSRAIGP